MIRFICSFAVIPLLWGCSSSSSLGTTDIPATGVVVDPAQFLGGVACVDAPGAMRTYVARIFEVRGAPPGRVEPTGAAPLISAPTGCTRRVIFQNIDLGVQYAATIDGYDRADLRPSDSDPAVLVDAANPSVVVSPRWTTSCGLGTTSTVTPTDAGLGDAALDAATPAPIDTRSLPDGCVPLVYPNGAAPPLDGPVCTLGFLSLTVRGCAPLQLHGGPQTATGVSVDVGAAGGCTSPSGDIGEVTVVRRGTSDAKRAACGTPVVFEDLSPGSLYTFDALAVAHSDAGSVSLQTTCSATAIGGVVVPASCDPPAVP